MKKILFTLIGILSILAIVGDVTNGANIPDKIVVANSKEDGEVYIVGNTLKYVDSQEYKFGQLVFNINDSKFSMAFVTKCSLDRERYANHSPAVIFYKGELVNMLRVGKGENLWMVLILQRTSEIVCEEKLENVGLISYDEAKKLSFKYTSDSLFSEK